MNIENNLIIKIETAEKTNLSKNQKLFNSYTDKITKLKTELNDIKAKMELADRFIIKEIYPIENKIIEKRLESLRVLENQYHNGPFDNAEKKILTQIILTIAENLIFEHEKIEAIPYFNQFNDIPFEELVNQEEKETAEERQTEKNHFDEGEFFENSKGDGQHTKEKPKSKAQLEREEKLKKDENDMLQSARKIYMDLMKQFHPDLESNEKEKERKTIIIQQVTDAYQKKDLFQLLKLQAEHLSIEKDKISQLADENLKNINKTLKSQIEELEWEIFKAKGGIFNPQNFYITYCLPKDIEAVFKSQKRKIKAHLKRVALQTEAFRDKDHLREFIKNFR